MPMPKGLMGTRVENPTARNGEDRFIKCRHCQLIYTRLGFTRHSHQCTSNPRNKK
jgi:hypothetical protein